MEDTPSALNNDVIKPPVPPEIKEEVPVPGAKENVYQNLIELQKKKLQTGPVEQKGRNVFIMRHGERIDFCFGSWVPYCFDETGNYVRKDLNMPKTLPARIDGSNGYLKDSPITNIGVMQASLIGESFKDKSIDIQYAYCSPAYRCVQTCDGFLRGLGKKDETKIRIEPGLFEWTLWYPDGPPDWMTAAELIKGGYNIDESYEPLVKIQELKEAKESCEQFYMRNAFVTRGVLSANPTGNVLLIGHSATLDTCSRDLLGQSPRQPNEMIKIIQKIPYCGLFHVAHAEDRWEAVEPHCLPPTHSNNQRFDWKMLIE